MNRATLLVALLLVAGCSRGGACADNHDCAGSQVCDRTTGRCGAPRPPGLDLMTLAPVGDLRAVPDQADPPDLFCDIPAGWHYCDGVCISPLGSFEHCSGCGHSCAGADLGARTACCNAGCVDLATNTHHCGYCFNECGPSPFCCNGGCSNSPCGT